MDTLDKVRYVTFENQLRSKAFSIGIVDAVLFHGSMKSRISEIHQYVMTHA